MKYKIWIVIGCLVLIFIMAGVSVYAIKEMPSETIETMSEIQEINGDKNHIVDYGDYTLIDSFSEFTDNESLEAYRTRNTERLSMIPENEKVKAAVTFEKVLSEDEVKQVLGNEVSIIRVRIKSYPEGSGKIPFPPTQEDRDKNKIIEKAIGNKIEGFRLIDGYVSADIRGKKHELQMISENPLVFDVSIGPVELMENHSNAIIRRITDISYDLERIRGFQ
jgi:hypothetical protein